MNGEEASTSVASFHVDVSKIQSADSNDQQAELQELGIRAFNQQDFEEGWLICVKENHQIKLIHYRSGCSSR